MSYKHLFLLWKRYCLPDFLKHRICCLRASGQILAHTWSTADCSLLQVSDCSLKQTNKQTKTIRIHTNMRLERGVQTLLTMCHPTMFTLIASPQVNLPWLKTFTRTIYQCASDGLENKKRKKYQHL